jgi:succinate dehydrogenase / fumarate reductase cytochrome b subunit
MSWITQTLSSSIGKKLVMALTGLFLSIFLVIHLLGNLQLFNEDGGLSFNTYAVMMTTNPLIKTVSYGLYFFIILHAVQGIGLALRNRKARGIAYRKFDNQSSWASRNMAILGTVLLVYIAVHMNDFWFQYKFGYLPYTEYKVELATNTVLETNSMPTDFVLSGKMTEQISEDGTTKTVVVKNLYAEVQEAFTNIWLVLFYVVAMAAVSFHLLHGFKSAFQTLGMNHVKYNGLIHFLGVWVFAILIPLAFAAMPIYFYLTSQN